MGIWSGDEGRGNGDCDMGRVSRFFAWYRGRGICGGGERGVSGSTRRSPIVGIGLGGSFDDGGWTHLRVYLDGRGGLHFLQSVDACDCDDGGVFVVPSLLLWGVLCLRL